MNCVRENNVKFFSSLIFNIYFLSFGHENCVEKTGSQSRCVNKFHMEAKKTLVLSYVTADIFKNSNM